MNVCRLLLSVIFLMVAVQLKAQCPSTQLNVKGGKESCIKDSKRFEITDPPVYDHIVYKFGTTSQTSSQLTIEHAYGSMGAYLPKASFINANGDTLCTVSAPDSITVYDNPNAAFQLNSPSKQCFEGNEFCFTDQSTKSANNAPIKDYSWSFADGGASQQQSPCHTYAQKGTYTILLEITDSNGCIDTVQKTNAVTVRPALKPQFIVKATPNCPTTDAEFDNWTNQSVVDSFYWRFDDGTWDSTQQNWNNFTHTYAKDGEFLPTLYVKNQFGCKDSFNSVKPVKNTNYEPQLTTTVDTPCWSNPEVQFQFEPKREDAEFFLWDFGNPASGADNTNEGSWTPTHEFVQDYYDTFHVTLQILEHGCPKTFEWDMEVKMHGPQAAIKSVQPQISPKHDFQLPQDQPIPRDSFVRVNNNPCLLGENPEIQYVEVDNTLPSGFTDTISEYPIFDGNQLVKNMHTVIDTLGTHGQVRTWTPGDKIPNNQVYGTQGGTYNPQSMHDTDLFVPACQGPNLVRFTNNTTKIRFQRNDSVPFYDSVLRTNIAFNNQDTLVLSKLIRYDTVLDHSVTAEFNGSSVNNSNFHISHNYRKAFFVWDQKPASNTGQLTFEFVGVDRDQTHFPYTAVDDTPPPQFQGPVNRDTFGPGSGATGYKSAPWGSDSLEYLWRFNDPTGEPCTTTTAAHSKISEFFLKVETTKQNYGGSSPSVVFDDLTHWDTIYNDEVTVYNDSGNEISQNYNVQIGQNAEISFPGATPNQQTLTIEYTARDNSLSGTRCNFSTAYAPWHKYEETGCHTATLQAFDPVTNCKSTAQVSIVMDQPDAGWDKSFFWEHKSPQFIYNGQINPRLNNGVLLFDSLMTYANRDDRIIDFRNLKVFVNGSNYSESKYTVDSTSEGAKINFSTEPTTNSTVEVTYEALQPYYLDQNTPIAIKNMSYQKQKMFPEYQPNNNSNALRRGLMLDSDGPCPSPPGSEVNYWQELNFEETLPLADCSVKGKNYGFVYSRDKLIEDTLQCSNGQKITYDWYETPQIENSYQLRAPFEQPGKFQYTEPGCKTIGLWINNGGCTDTFWYEDYQRITAIYPDFSLLDPDSQNVMTSSALKQSLALPVPNLGNQNNEGTSYDSSLTLSAIVDSTAQNQVTDYALTLTRDYPTSSKDHGHELGKVQDTGYVFCDSMAINPQTGDTSWLNCFTYPIQSCQKEPINDFSPNELSQIYAVKDTLHFLNLDDTIPQLNIQKPGIYSITSEVTNASGCYQSQKQDKIYIGHYADFEPQVPQDNLEDNDSIVCPGDTVFFDNPGHFQTGCTNVEKPNFPRYWNQQFNPNKHCESYIEQTNYFKDPLGARNGTSPDTPYQAEQVDYDLNGDNIYETQWVPSQQRYYQNGNLLATRDVDGDNIKDTVPYYVYDQPGIYSPTIRSIDSTGRVQIKELSNKINVTDLTAYFALASTPGNCAPQEVDFVDNSSMAHNYEYEYDSMGNVIDSSIVDHIQNYRWNFGDSQSDSIAYNKNPTHVYVNNGEFPISLITTTKAGCKDSTTTLKHNGDTTQDYTVNIEGPQPKFELLDTQACLPGLIKIKDYSKDVSVWTFDKGNGTSSTFNSRANDSIFTLAYQSSGTYNISLIAGDSVANVQTPQTGDSKYCTASHPSSSNSKTVTIDSIEAGINDTAKNDSVFTFHNHSGFGQEYKWIFFNDTVTHQNQNPQWSSSHITNARDTLITTNRDQNTQHNYGSDYGSFDVCIIATTNIGCQDTACTRIENDSPTYIAKEESKLEVNIDFANDELILDFGSANYPNTRIKLLEPKGQAIKLERNIAGSGKQRVNVPENLAAGIYLVKVVNENGTVIEKVMIH